MKYLGMILSQSAMLCRPEQNGAKQLARTKVIRTEDLHYDINIALRRRTDVLLPHGSPLLAAVAP